MVTRIRSKNANLVEEGVDIRRRLVNGAKYSQILRTSEFFDDFHHNQSRSGVQSSRSERIDYFGVKKAHEVKLRFVQKQNGWLGNEFDSDGEQLRFLLANVTSVLIRQI